MATPSSTCKDRYLQPPPPHCGGHMGATGGPPSLTDLTFPQEWLESGHKSRRRSTIHSYAISSTLHTLPNDAHTLRQVAHMTEAKALKNIFALSLAFMLVFTGFVSLQSLQSTLHAQGGLGVVSLSVIYGSTVLSCLLAPWLINRITTKWTMVLAFSLYFAYFAANFYPRHYLLLPLSVMLGALAGPMWSAQATYVTTLAMTFAQHRKLSETSDETINKFMGIFFGFFRSSQIWGNLVSALVLSKNETSEYPEYSADYASTLQGRGVLFNSSVVNGGDSFLRDSYAGDHYFTSMLMAASGNVTHRLCGVNTCLLNLTTADGTYSNVELGAAGSASLIPESTKYLLLTACLGCGLMGVVIVVALVDQVKVGKRNADPEFSQTSFELFVWTLRMARDSKCLLLMPLVVFMGLEQGFMFSDFTKEN
ncbi:hypothetical protein ACOMHN_018821 [Nucella lapillus]